MKLKDLPPPKENGTHARLWLRHMFDNEFTGTLFTPYLFKGKGEKRSSMRVPFLKDGDDKNKIKLYRLSEISNCKVIE